MMRIFLDDERNYPIGEEWIVVRNVEDLLYLVDHHHLQIEELSFDNDLQRPLEGIHGLTAIKERILDEKVSFPSLKRITVHSANTVAAKAMLHDLLFYRKHGVIPDIEIRKREADGDLYPLAKEDLRQVNVFCLTR